MRDGCGRTAESNARKEGAEARAEVVERRERAARVRVLSPAETAAAQDAHDDWQRERDPAVKMFAGLFERRGRTGWRRRCSSRAERRRRRSRRGESDDVIWGEVHHSGVRVDSRTPGRGVGRRDARLTTGSHKYCFIAFAPRRVSLEAIRTTPDDLNEDASRWLLVFTRARGEWQARCPLTRT